MQSKRTDISQFYRLNVDLPIHPEIERIYIIPIKLILHNSAAANNANVCMMITDLSQLAEALR